MRWRARWRRWSCPRCSSATGEGDRLAVNDISFHRRPDGRVAELAYSIEGEELGEVRCDGLVVSTPAGSTGYNLANGGPVLAWGVEGFVVSFIAPHTLTARSLVVAPGDALEVTNRSTREEVDVTTDGRPVSALAPEAAMRDSLRAPPGAARPGAGGDLLPPPARQVRAAQPTRRATGASQRGRSVGPRWYTCSVLLELRIENLLLIERAELRPGSGLTAITGETGAGKTVLAHALDLLLGGKPRAGIVRPGAREAYVEGVFELPARAARRARAGRRCASASTAEAPRRSCSARRVGESGRTSAFVAGRSATAADLAALGGRLVAFFGQHEHRRLTLASAQLDLLDGFCGREHLAAARRAGLAPTRAARELERELGELRERAGTRDRDLDLLAFEIDEIDALEPSEEEKEALLGERERLRRDGRSAGGRRRRGGGDRARRPATAAVRRAAGRRPSGWPSGVAGRGPGAGRARRAAAPRCASRPRTSAASCGATRTRSRPSPAASRRSRSASRPYDRLERKHGGSVAAVLAHAERCRARARAARAGRGGHRARRRPSSSEALARTRRAGRPARRRARRGRAARWPSACARSSARWRWRAPASRCASSRARRSARRAPSAWS